MTENAYFLGTTNHTETTDNATKQRIMSSDGYLVGVGSELAVIQHTPADMIVIVGTGEAWIRGVRYENTAAFDIAIAAADATNPRIDRIVARLTWSTDTISIVRLAGTAAASPAAPALTQSASVWEISLAQIAVGAGVATILTANITDERLTQYCGPAACRMGFLVSGTDGALSTTGKPIAMGTAKITGLGDPSSAQDAATQAYVLTKAWVAGMIGLWSGSIATIPAGYVLCNGSNSTPDLRGKFVLGAGGAYAVGTAGGEETHLLTAAESGVPEHTHDIPAYSSGSGNAPAIESLQYRGAPALKTENNTAAPASSAHNNMPPYYALAYIMKT